MDGTARRSKKNKEQPEEEKIMLQTDLAAHDAAQQVVTPHTQSVFYKMELMLKKKEKLEEEKWKRKKKCRRRRDGKYNSKK